MPELDLLLSLIISILLPVFIGLLTLLLIWIALLIGWHSEARFTGSVSQVRSTLSDYFHRGGREFRHAGDDLIVRLDSFAAAQFRFMGDDGNVTVVCRGREGEAWWWFAPFLLIGYPGMLIVVSAALCVAVRAKRKAATFIRSTFLHEYNGVTAQVAA